jgi:hypothetical protein
MNMNNDIPSVRVMVRIPKKVADGTTETKDVLCTIRHFSAELLVEILKNKDLSKGRKISVLPDNKNGVEERILISLDQIISIVPDIQQTSLRKDTL